MVDGYITRTRTVSYSDGTSSTQREKLLHCNWGWGGTADGYYYYNMFDPGSGPTATDVIDAYGGRDGAKYELCTSVIGYRR